MTLAAILIGLPSLFFSGWIALGLYRRARGKFQETTHKNTWFLGVGEDFSRMVGIPLWVIRIFFILYAFIGIGIILYILYYIMMRLRMPPEQKKVQKSMPEVTKIESRHYQ